MAAQTPKYDVMVLGASGFTGKYVARTVVNLCPSKGLTFCFAGRDMKRVRRFCTAAIADAVTAGLAEPAIVEVDINNKTRLREVVGMARYVLNCTGPYRYYGEPVVAACVDAGTNYLDISGEPEFIERMALKYDEAAREKGCFVISACGFDSVPADLGAACTADLIVAKGGTPAAVQSFLSLFTTHGRGSAGHYTTYECVVLGMSSVPALRKMRRELTAKEPAVDLKPIGRLPPFQTGRFSRGGSWALPFMGADNAIVRRTQKLMKMRDPKYPHIQYSAYFTIQRLPTLIIYYAIGFVFMIMLLTSFTRKILLAFPRLFTLGMVSHAGPTEEQLAGTTFTMEFEGLGYSSSADRSKHPDIKVNTRIAGAEPGYVATPLLLVHSMLCLEDAHYAGSLKVKGGVLTPAAALHPLGLMKRLERAGVLQFKS